MELEITRMLTISLSHISRETADLINDECDTWWNSSLPACYTKGEYGYMIHVPEDYLVSGEDGVEETYPDVPDDLHDCMLLARENNCQWLCFDRDGLVVDGLEVFDW